MSFTFLTLKYYPVAINYRLATVLNDRQINMEPLHAAIGKNNIKVHRKLSK